MYLKVNSNFIIKFNLDGSKAIAYNLINYNEYYFVDTEAKILYELINNFKNIDDVEVQFDREKVGLTINKVIGLKICKTYSNNIISEPLKPINELLLKLPKFRKFSLDRLVFEITGECNLSCSFCLTGDIVYRSCGCKKWESNNILLINDYISIIDQAKRFNLKQIDFLGGEPLIRWELLKEIIEYLDDTGITIRLFTNGSLIDYEKVMFFKKHNVNLIIQILGFENHYNKLGIESNEYKKIKDAVKLVSDNSLNSIIYILVNRINEQDINKIKLEYEKIGFNYEEVYLYPSNEYFSKLYLDKMLSPEIRSLKLNLFNYQLMEYVNCCLNSQIYISCDGNIYPCMMLRKIIGNINNNELWEIFHKGEYKKFWEVKKHDLDTCKDCELSFKCFDCRALEYNKTLNLHGMYYCNRVTDC